jgi:hypothetical protein
VRLLFAFMQAQNWSFQRSQAKPIRYRSIARGPLSGAVLFRFPVVNREDRSRLGQGTLAALFDAQRRVTTINDESSFPLVSSALRHRPVSEIRLDAKPF